MNLEFLVSAFQPTAEIPLTHLAIQLILLLFLSNILSFAYKLFGNTLSNRSRLAAIFPLMSATTMLVITIIKSSLALSLGLVGALSIVRFRSAIKDPEELVYIFLAVALGLGFGADQPLLTSVFFILVMLVIIVQSLFQKRIGKKFLRGQSVYVDLRFSKSYSLTKITHILEKHSRAVTLNRFEQNEVQEALFLINPKSAQALEELRKEFLELDQEATFSLLEYQPLF